jgi:diacylglycerol kinase family enzyme
MISSVFTVLTGEEWPLDIIKSQTPKPEPQYSFLSIVFGIVADVDIESEKFRYMGDIRFSIMAMMKIIVKNTFSGKLCYLPVEDASVDLIHIVVKLFNFLMVHQNANRRVVKNNGIWSMENWRMAI